MPKYHTVLFYTETSCTCAGLIPTPQKTHIEIAEFIMMQNIHVYVQSFAFDLCVII